MRVLYFTNDLMFTSHVEPIVKRCGGELIGASSLSDLLSHAQEEVSLILLDLSASGADPSEIVDHVKNDFSSHPQIVAYAPHVHENKLDAARNAGCDQVLTRGQFRQSIDTIIQGAHSSEK